MRLKTRFTTREIAILALFSVVWAAIEINLGFILKIVKLPFAGSLLTFLGLIVIFLGRNSVPKRGTAILMGVTTAFLKLIYLGGLAIYPIIGILVEVILVEIGLGGNYPKRAQFLTAGALALVWTFFHPFFTQGLLAGWGILKVYLLIVNKGAKLIGLQEQQALLIFTVLFGIHLGLGILAGSLSWKLSRIIYRRLNGYQDHKITINSETRLNTPF